MEEAKENALQVETAVTDVQWIHLIPFVERGVQILVEIQTQKTDHLDEVVALLSTTYTCFRNF